MGFLTEILAVTVVWLSSFALCQFGVSVEHGVCPHARSAQARTISRSPRAAPIAVNAPSRVAEPAAHDV